jgi:hypothetical protein
MIYFSDEKNETKIRTSLSQNLKILEILEIFLRNNFFNKERQIRTNLLILKDSKINIKDIIVFE